MTSTQRDPLTEKRQATFDALLDAAERSLIEHGFDGLTVRGVASEAGVTHTTAYSFVTSKSQLIAELHLRTLRRLDAPQFADQASPAERVEVALAGPAMLFANAPAVAHAVQAALLVGQPDPDVRALREEAGAITLGRLRAALPDASWSVLDIIFAAYNGAMVRAGTGNSSYEDVAPLAARLVELLGDAVHEKPAGRTS